MSIFKNIGKDVKDFFSRAGSEALGKKWVEETATRTIRWATDPDHLRHRFERCLIAISPKGKKIMEWHKRTGRLIKKKNKWVKNTNRLIVDGKKIPEHTFVNLLAGFKCNDSQLEDLLKQLDEMTEDVFCNYLALLWNNNIQQTWGGLMDFLVEKGGSVGKYIIQGLKRTRKQGGNVIKEVAKKASGQTGDVISGIASSISEGIKKIDDQIDPNYYA